jgi:hypothetical protein
LKNSFTRPPPAILESRSPALGLSIALLGGNANQSFASSATSEFFNSIDPFRTFGTAHDIEAPAFQNVQLCGCDVALNHFPGFISC